jgi:hypothetical protein
VKELAYDSIAEDAPELVIGTQVPTISRRVLRARDARQQRRAVVTAVTAERDALRINTDDPVAPGSWSLLQDKREAYARPSSTLSLERASPLLKRDSTSRPKWQPTTCTAPGVTCAGNGKVEGAVKLEMRSKSQPDTEPQSSPLSQHEAQPTLKLPKWWPLLCTTFGISCADFGASDHGSDSYVTEPSSLKREAKSLPMAVAHPFYGGQKKQPPKWQPTSCTSRGITCGDSSGVEEGATGDDTGPDGTSSTTSQPGAVGQKEKRNARAAAESRFQRPEFGTFTDDDGNVVKIERASALGV